MTLLNYGKWKELYEQTKTAPPIAGSAPLDFIVSAGASAKPMSDAVLTANQKFPASTDTASKNHLYEMTLATALSGDFSKATIGEAVNGTDVDQIIFDGKSIKGTGKISIEWNKENFSKKIQVSGNGALVLARAASYTSEFKDRGILAGVLELELSAQSLYANSWDIITSGLGIDTLAAQLRGRITAATFAVADKSTRTGLETRWNRKTEAYMPWIETQYSPSIGERDPKTAKYTPIYPPNLPENTQLQPLYLKYSSDDIKINTKIIAGLIKKSMIDPGLDALYAYIPTYYSGKLTGANPQYVDRMIKKIQTNITESKTKFTVAEISTNIASTLVSTPGGSSPAPTSKVSVSGTTYKEGQSKK